MLPSPPRDSLKAAPCSTHGTASTFRATQHESAPHSHATCFPPAGPPRDGLGVAFFEGFRVPLHVRLDGRKLGEDGRGLAAGGREHRTGIGGECPVCQLAELHDGGVPLALKLLQLDAEHGLVAKVAEGVSRRLKPLLARLDALVKVAEDGATPLCISASQKAICKW